MFWAPKWGLLGLLAHQTAREGGLPESVSCGEQQDDFRERFLSQVYSDRGTVPYRQAVARHVAAQAGRKNVTEPAATAPPGRMMRACFCFVFVGDSLGSRLHED